MKKISVLVLFLAFIFSPVLVRAENGVLEQAQVSVPSVIAREFPAVPATIFSRLFQVLNSKQVESQMRSGSRPAVEKLFNKPPCSGIDCATRGSVYTSTSDTATKEAVVKNMMVLPTCLYGDLYDRQTGSFCLSNPGHGPCRAGDIFNSQNGTRCVSTNETGVSYHPVDVNHDYRVTLEEVTAYASAHPSSDLNLISAIKIWRNGETYLAY
ncbi:hypothetical protein IT398_01470 [Candidatus Nomurabacteria bacterium]|nr:hypothetical protein [Candidatus Nomurabacteria bacterium]